MPCVGLVLCGLLIELKAVPTVAAIRKGNRAEVMRAILSLKLAGAMNPSHTQLKAFVNGGDTYGDIGDKGLFVHTVAIRKCIPV